MNPIIITAKVPPIIPTEDNTSLLLVSFSDAGIAAAATHNANMIAIGRNAIAITIFLFIYNFLNIFFKQLQGRQA